MTKIDIVSGFLGAGKTTLIKKLLKEAFVGEKVVLIENEFGEIGIDGGFLKESGIEIREINAGCICCSLIGDFSSSLIEVLSKYEPDRIIIEPSGVGKLSEVKTAVSAVLEPGWIELNTASVVVDANKCKMYMRNFGEFFLNQVQNAQTIILSRTDMVSEESVIESVNLLRANNGHATIVTTPWSKIEGKDILAAMEGTNKLEQIVEALKKANAIPKECGHTHSEEHIHNHEEGDKCACEMCNGEHHHHHEANEVFTAIGIEGPASYTKEEITNILKEFDNKMYGEVIRAKGIVPSKEKEEWIYFDFVPGEIELRDGKPDVTGKISIIGAKIEENSIRELFK